MSKLFLHLLNISITAGWIVLVVVLLRFVLKKAPKWIRVVLWGLVALRLMLPVSIESVTSLVPSAETVHVEPVTYTIIRDSDPHPLPVEGEQIVLQSGFSALNSAVNPTPAKAAEHFDTVAVLKSVAGWVWLAGVCGMLLYALISFLRLRHRVCASVLLEKGVYVCDEISDPFILGLIVPKIYLPSGMDEQTRAYVLAHERAHLKRFDFIWKPLGFFLLSVYWFNPLLWLAYLLLCRDIELACDEKVVKELDDAGKAAYSEALVHASVTRRMVSACPLAFGETGVKGRVKSILNYKKPAFWIILVAILAGIVTAVCFLTMPKKDKIKDLTSDGNVTVWYEDWDLENNAPDGPQSVSVDAFPGVTFRWKDENWGDSILAEENGETRKLFSGMPVWNVFFADVTGDGKPELCASVYFGSGIVDEHIVVYDYVNKQSYVLWDRGTFDYHLSLDDGALQVIKRIFNTSILPTDNGAFGELVMEDGLLCCHWRNDGSSAPLIRELHESEIVGEWLVEEETDNDGNVLYTFALGDLWKEYNFKPDGTVIYNETVPVSSDYEKAFGHPVDYRYAVYDNYVHIEDGRSCTGYYDAQTQKLKLNYQPSPGQYVYATLRRMGEDITDAPTAEVTPEPSPVPLFGSWTPGTGYHKIEPMGTVPEVFHTMIDQNLFRMGLGQTLQYTYGFADRVLTYSPNLQNDTVTYTISFDLYDLYGTLLLHAETTLDPYFQLESAIATTDGGIVFAVSFTDRSLDDGTWASEHYDKATAYIIKIGADGKQQWKTALPTYTGWALGSCIEYNGAYFFFGNYETPEQKQLGIVSSSNISIIKIGYNGTILKQQELGADDFDTVSLVDTDADGFILYADTQNSKDEFAASRFWKMFIDDDLNVIGMEPVDEYGHRFARYLGVVQGKRVFTDDPRYFHYSDGFITCVLDYGAFILVVSENDTGIYENQPKWINMTWNYTETVYAAYDLQGNLLWKTAVDSSPDYDALATAYYAEP